MTVECIIPVFNEERILDHNIRVLLDHVSREEYASGFLLSIVVNGSTDESAAIAQKLEQEFPGRVKAVVLRCNGKGNAIWECARKSTADIVMYMDIDLAVSLDHLTPLLRPVLERKIDLSIASRLLPRSDTRRSFFRTVTSRIYNALSRILLGHQITDLQCGFKAARREVFERVLPNVRDRAWFFDTEFLMLALRSGFSLQELPVSWEESRYAARKSKIRFLSDSIRFLRALVLLKWRFLKEDKCVPVWKRHGLALLLALCVGGLYVGPHVYFAHQPDYEGIFMSESSDADFYLTTINKSYVSGWKTGNPYMYEYRTLDNPFQYHFIEGVLAKTGRFLGLSIDQLAILITFVFPALLTLCVYYFAYILSGSRSGSILVSGAVLLGEELARPSISDFLGTLALKSPYTEFLIFSRPINPSASGILFFLALAAMYSLFTSPRSPRSIILSGVLLGALAYVYFYFWVFVTVLLGVLFVCALVRRDIRLLIDSTLSGCIGLIISIPFLSALVHSMRSGTGGALLSAVSSHAFIFEKMIWIPLTLYVLIFLYARWGSDGHVRIFAKRISTMYLFVLLLLITGVIVSNQQVITGKLVQQHHFHFFTNIPLFLLASAVLFTETLRVLRPVYARVVTIGVLFVVFWYAAGVQISSYRAHAPSYARYQKLSPIFTTLRSHSDAVVLADSFVSTRLTMYTQDYAYMSPYDSTFSVPKERLLHDYYVTLALRGISSSTVRAYVYESSHRVEIGYLLFGGQYYRDLCGSAGCFPDAVLEEIITGYETFAARPLAQNVTTYRADYVIVDRTGDKDWRIDLLPDRQKITESGDFVLYTLSRPL